MVSGGGDIEVWFYSSSRNLVRRGESRVVFVLLKRKIGRVGRGEIRRLGLSIRLKYWEWDRDMAGGRGGYGVRFLY